jgi:molybdate transport system ATP-binding protein
VSGLRLDVTVPGERFPVAIAWETAHTALGLFGPSGAGKTTVLEALAGLRAGARGRIEVGGRCWLDSARGIRLLPEQRGVGYVPQEMLLFPHLDVLGNLRFGEGRARRAARRLSVERILEVLELRELAQRPVQALSGGERQRVALGRALASAPELLLLDEPLASLDLPLRRRILPYLLRVREEFAIPTVHVSHDPAEVSLLCQELCVLGSGQVLACGRPHEVLGLGSGVDADALVNVLRGSVVSVADSLAMIEIEPGLVVAVTDPGGLGRGQQVACELRATDILLARGSPPGLSAQNILAATVREVGPAVAADSHAAAVVTVALGATQRPLTVVVSRVASRELGLAPASPVYVVFKAQSCRLLAAL